MKRLVLKWIAVALCGLALAVAPTAHAWEPATHAGVAEEAALNSDLHSALVAHGWDAGLYTSLTIADAAQPALVGMIRRIAPSLGVFLDAKGAAPALSWLVAGAIIADIGSAQHHFYHVGSERGWTLGRLAAKLAGMPTRGIAAVEWVTHTDNALGAPAFYAQLAASVAAATPAQRSQHLAAALIAAGAITHVVADMGSPSHIKGDEASHTAALAARGDRNNRLERVATLAFGRLGVPAPATTVEATSLRQLMADPAIGLAAITDGQWYSENTLPRSGDDDGAKPALPTRLSLMAASQETGTTLRNRDGVCLAHYRLAVGRLSFWLDDACRLEQTRAILPQVTSYARAALQFLFRGNLSVGTMGNAALIGNRGVGLGKGTLEVFSQASTGARTRVATLAIDALAAQAELEVPLGTGTAAYAATFVGVDVNGQPLTAVGIVSAP